MCAVHLEGRARCLALELQPEIAHSTSLPSEGAFGLRPQDLKSAYFPEAQPDVSESEPQTIALVDAYNDPQAEAALGIYDREFSLPECAAANGCFQQVNQNGETGNLPYPQDSQAIQATETRCETTTPGESPSESETRAAACLEVEEVDGWAREISINIEVAHAICQNCQIVLVEANLPDSTDLEAAEETAARSQSKGGVGASEISNSWGIPEPLSDSEAFNHPGIVITAAAGDFGYLNWTEAEEAQAKGTSYYSGVEYPASSPHVIAVGATELALTAAGTRQSETVWNEDPSYKGKNEGADGGGCSLEFKAEIWQLEVPDWASVGCGERRAVADVSADGDPHTGVAVYYGEPKGGGSWRMAGGTSVSSSIVAAMFALAGGAHGVAYPAQTLYSHLGSKWLYDISNGGNGHCDGNYTRGCSGSIEPPSALDCGAGVLVCNAAVGYDGPSGVGAPDGLGAFLSGADQGAHTESSREPSQATAAQTQPSDTPDSPASGPTVSARGSAVKPVVITGLGLLATATQALARERPSIDRLAFYFTISAPDLVRVGLAKLLHRHGRRYWQVLRDAIAARVQQGSNRQRLRAPGRLAPGLYRLRLRPQGGNPRSLLFTVHSQPSE